MSFIHDLLTKNEEKKNKYYLLDRKRKEIGYFLSFISEVFCTRMTRGHPTLTAHVSFPPPPFTFSLPFKPYLSYGKKIKNSNDL
jgi:hypothetical protein